MQEAGAGFAGFAAWLDMSPADSDMFGMPDGDSVIQLPWNKEIAWVASDLYMDGKPVEASPRIALKRQIEKASKKSIPYEFVERRQGDIASCWADPSKAKIELDWKAELNLDEMMEDSWRWQNQNPNGYID